MNRYLSCFRFFWLLFVAFSASAHAAPAITTPVQGTELPNESVEFSWTANEEAVDQWWLFVGSAPGDRSYHNSGNLGAALTDTVVIPTTSESSVHARLWYRVSAGQWLFVDSEYSTSTTPDIEPDVTSPAAGSALASDTINVTWTANGRDVDEWWLYAGSTVGGRQYYDSGSLTTTFEHTVTGLPVDGSSVFLRLWYRVAGSNWNSLDVTYDAATINSAPEIDATLLADGLSGSTDTISWNANGANVVEWWLYAGSNPGGRDYYDSGNLGSAASVVASGLPTDGSTVHLRLWYRTPAATWKYSDSTIAALQSDIDFGSFELVFEDEFTGSSLDASKWHTNLLWGPYWAINNEEQMYVDTLHMHEDLAGSPSDPFELTGSTLKINAIPTSIETPPPPRPPRDSDLYKREASTYRYGDAVGEPGEPGYRPPYDPENVNYLSGIITSYDSFKMTHGYVETRAKLPAGRGLWPAFWMLWTHYLETIPEIDVMEFLGQDVDRLYNNYHYFDVPAGWKLRSTPSFAVYATDWTQDFHTFGMQWSPKKITWYVDGKETHSITDQTVHAASGTMYKITNQAMYLIANLAVGGNWPGAPDDTTAFPATYEIDYIRAYKRKQADPIDLAADYQLMFGDEFNGTSLDPLKWESHFIWGPYLPINNEQQYYIDALNSDSGLGYSPFSFDETQVNGETINFLKITARTHDDPEGAEPPPVLPQSDAEIWNNNKTFNQNASYLPQEFTSGILTSYESFRFVNGYAEIRARVPKGEGLWPAFWLLNRYYVSQQPEIDILEMRGRRPDQIVHNYHRYRPGGILDSDEYITTKGTPDEGYADGEFHIFGARWRPGRIDWYVDGVREHSYIGDDVGYQLMYVLVNLAVGGGFDPGAMIDPSEFPKSLDIDYIRVYQDKDD